MVIHFLWILQAKRWRCFLSMDANEALHPHLFAASKGGAT